MLAVKVEITRFVDPHQPGLVECRLVDAFGKAWTFIEKVPVVTDENLNEQSSYPRQGVIACLIVRRYEGDGGREIVRIDTSRPWYIESTDEMEQFDVLAEQLTEVAWREEGG